MPPSSAAVRRIKVLHTVVWLFFGTLFVVAGLFVLGRWLTRPV